MADSLWKKIALLSGTLLILFLSSCNFSVKKRPYGYVRLGLVKDLLAPETYFKEHNLLLRHDSSGFSVMSTMCTSDLSPLLLRAGQKGPEWFSEYSGSVYDAVGNVLKGPAKAPLPYYNLAFDAYVYGGPKNTLYAEIGNEKPKEWRLEIAGLPK